MALPHETRAPKSPTAWTSPQRRVGGLTKVLRLQEFSLKKGLKSRGRSKEVLRDPNPAKMSGRTVASDASWRGDRSLQIGAREYKLTGSN